MAQKSFATGGTQKKLKTIEDYLNFYTTALSSRFRLIYLDAFAGTGGIPYGGDLPLFEGQIEIDDVISGSARRALDIKNSFDRYIFVDRKKSNTDALEKLKRDFPNLSDRVEVVRGDANDVVKEFCSQFDFNGGERAIIFLDPFGSSVDFKTIRTIGETPGIDLWYLFPSGLGVTRQISQDGTIQKDAEDSLNRIYGTSDWKNNLILKENKPDLFADDTETQRKIATADAATRYMIERMKSVFEGGVLDKWLPLGKKGGHWYSLIFAWSNPSDAAKSLASTVARDIMSRK